MRIDYPDPLTTTIAGKPSAAESAALIAHE